MGHHLVNYRNNLNPVFQFMARSQTTFNKKEREKKKLQKKKEKLARREERKEQAKDGSLDSMMAYVDEYGNITDTPPDPDAKPKKIKASDIEIGVPKKEKEDLEGERRGRVAFEVEEGPKGLAAFNVRVI